MTLWAADLSDWGPPPFSSAEVVELTSPAPALEVAMSSGGDLVALRYARGCRSFGTQLGTLVVAYGWLSTGPEWIGEAGVEFRPAAKEGYVWNCLTLPAHRRRGLFTAVLRGIAETARAEGLGRLWMASLEGTAEKAVQGLGFGPALHLDVPAARLRRRVLVTAAAGAPRDLVEAALRALAVRAGTLRSGPPRRQ